MTTRERVDEIEIWAQTWRAALDNDEPGTERFAANQSMSAAVDIVLELVAKSRGGTVPEQEPTQIQNDSNPRPDESASEWAKRMSDEARTNEKDAQSRYSAIADGYLADAITDDEYTRLTALEDFVSRKPWAGGPHVLRRYLPCTSQVHGHSTDACGRVWAVSSYDLGGNAGYVVEAVFSSRDKADAWCESATKRWQKKWPEDHDPFEVEDFPLEFDPEAVDG